MRGKVAREAIKTIGQIGRRAGVMWLCAALAACASAQDKAVLATAVPTDEVAPTPAVSVAPALQPINAAYTVPDDTVIAPMSQEAVDLALQAPELSQAITYRAEHRPADMVGAFRTAAARGNPVAQLQLAQLYHRGQDLPQDDAEASHWLHLAAAQGFGEAQVTLAESYFAGQGEPQDAAQGWRWLRAAEAQQRPAIWAMIGEVYLAGVTPVSRTQPQNIAEVIDDTTRQADIVAALNFFHRAAAAGDENGELALCLFYMKGEGGTARSAKDGQPWCDRAAARGNMEARQYSIARSQLPTSLPQREGGSTSLVEIWQGIGTGAVILIYAAAWAFVFYKDVHS